MHASLLGNWEGPGQLPSEKLQAGGRRREEGGGGSREGKRRWGKGGRGREVREEGRGEKEGDGKEEGDWGGRRRNGRWEEKGRKEEVKDRGGGGAEGGGESLPTLQTTVSGLQVSTEGSC